MARKKIISKKDRIDEINAKLSETSVPLDHASMSLAIREKAGGSISSMAIKTEAHGKWLTELQSKNPFIGKDYISKAPEYETDDKIIDVSEIPADETFMGKLEAGTQAYDPSIDYGEASVELKEKRQTGRAQDKIIDHCIVSNLTRKLLGKPESELIEMAKAELCNYHGDSEYESPIDIVQSIEYTRVIAIENKSDPKILK